MRSGIGKLPCEINQNLVSAVFKDVFVTSFDIGIYNLTDYIPSTVYCALLCFSIDCLAFLFHPLSNDCWQHVAKSVCRKKNRIPVALGSKLMVRKVGTLLEITAGFQGIFTNTYMSLGFLDNCEEPLTFRGRHVIHVYEKPLFLRKV
jgi:hypothetical protein